MAASTFDTLDATRALEAAGIERKHAEAQAAQLRVVAETKHEQLATKDDIATLQRDVATLTAGFDIMKWAMVFQGAVSLATLAAVLGLAWKLVP